MNTRSTKTSSETTPWGTAHLVTEFAPGILFYTTASHGGFWLSPERIMELPPELRGLGTWCGQPWYEEDCDATLVTLSFPKFFSEAEIYNAYEFLIGPGRPGYFDGVELWLQSPATVDIRIIVQAFGERHKEDFRIAGSITGGMGWRIRAVNLARTKAVLFEAKDYPELPQVFTLADIEKAGGVVIKTEDKPDTPPSNEAPKA